ncbi:MAG: hypothetical protein AB1646_06365 [Thermodesulfobacteriota bacterium]
MDKCGRKASPARENQFHAWAAFSGVLCRLLLGCVLALTWLPTLSFGSACDFLRFNEGKNLFAVDPDVSLRLMNPRGDRHLWHLGESKGIPPLFLRSKVEGLYDRVDFFYPLGVWEESPFRSKLRLTPLVVNEWSKVPPYEGYSRCLTLYHGRSDLGQDYWGFFPFFGYSHRIRGVDKDFFLLFPLYYESTRDDARTIRLLWPFITYANSPGRRSFKVWPLYGKDEIRSGYYNQYFLWPFFQKVVKHPGTDVASSYLAMPFPLYVQQQDCVSTSMSVLWPFFNYYKHRGGHERYSFWPFVKYGSGGGIDELNLFYLYSYKKDKRKCDSDSEGGSGYVSISGDEVFTERKFLLVSTIQKRFRKGFLVSSKYRFWPFGEYTWDLERGTHLKIPEFIPLKSDWFDLNLGRYLRLVDLRETPFTREISTFFGLSNRTELKRVPHVKRPPKLGDDDWQELFEGAFGKR